MYISRRQIPCDTSILCARLVAQLISATVTSRDLNKTYDRYVALINIYITSYTLHIALVFFFVFSHTLFHKKARTNFVFFTLIIGRVIERVSQYLLLWKSSIIVRFITKKISYTTRFVIREMIWTLQQEIRHKITLRFVNFTYFFILSKLFRVYSILKYSKTPRDFGHI